MTAETVVGYLTGYLMLINLTSIILYRIDKNIAAARGRGELTGSRIPEKALLSVDFAGGWMGGFFAQRKFRHKNNKLSYQWKFWLIVIASTSLGYFSLKLALSY